MSIGAIMALTEARRRRDDRGWYMEADHHEHEPRGRYYPDGMPPISPGVRAADHPVRTGSRDTDHRPYRHMEGVGVRRAEHDGEDRARMGGYGGFVWNDMEVRRPRTEEDDDHRMQRPGWPWGDDEQRGNITSMHDYAQGKEHKQHAKCMIGFRQEEDRKETGPLTKEEAEEWVDRMRTKDGRPGKRWTYDEIRQYAGNYGVSGEQNIIDFFVVLNMMYSDYCHVAKKLGVDRMDFYAGMAKAFLDDPDAVEGKLEKYREYIAKDEE